MDINEIKEEASAGRIPRGCWKIPTIHWLGGEHVTPACGAWAFSLGERTDLEYIPKYKITCQKCLKLLKQNKRDYFRYLSSPAITKEP